MGLFVSGDIRERSALGESFVSRTNISFNGQHLSATSFPSFTLPSPPPPVLRLRLATSTASSNTTNFTFPVTLYVAAFSARTPSTSPTTCRPGVVGANLAEPSICAWSACIWLKYMIRRSATDERLYVERVDEDVDVGSGMWRRDGIDLYSESSSLSSSISFSRVEISLEMRTNSA